MASLWTKTMTATQAAIAAFRTTFNDPGSVALQEEFDNRRAYFNLLWAYYSNTTFESLSRWEKYREAFTLYRYIRSIYNPTRRLVNFYVAQVYPGVLSEDASQLPDGVQLAIPLTRDTSDELKMAVAQFWQWSNWQSGNKRMVRFGAATGSVLVEIIDDAERGKVSASVRWPSLVKEIVLDDVGNVKAYTLEYETEDAEGKLFTYRKEVDRESTRTFKNDSPYTPEGQKASVIENFYGFVPAVWCKHLDEGSDWGAAAIKGSIGKIDEVNGLASHANDLIDKQIEAPGIIATDGKVGRIGEDRPRVMDENSAVADTREKNARMLILRAPFQTSWIPMASSLDPEKVLPHMRELLLEIEHDFPELSMYQELRKMSQVTAPGAARMMGDVYNRVLEVSANYDTQSIKLFQQAVAIAGFRLREGRGGWRNPTDQQKKFAPYNLDSYAQGDLNLSINPRPLVPMTEAEGLDLQSKRLDNAGKAETIFDADKVLEMAGVSDETERKEILRRRATINPILDNEQ